jgi:hypothetical protein
MHDPTRQARSLTACCGSASSKASPDRLPAIRRRSRAKGLHAHLTLNSRISALSAVDDGTRVIGDAMPAVQGVYSGAAMNTHRGLQEPGRPPRLDEAELLHLALRCDIAQRGWEIPDAPSRV